MNTTSKLAPKQVKGISKFQGSSDENYQAFTSIHNLEIYEIDLEKMMNTMIAMSLSREDKKAVLYGNNCRTSTICGVYINDKEKQIVLLNGWYNKKPVGWSKIKESIY